MTEQSSSVVDALRQSIREAGALGQFLSTADDNECRLAEKLSVSPAEIYDAELAIAERLDELKAIVRPFLELTERLEVAFRSGDDERCRELLQQLADDLAAAGYKGKKGKRR